MQAAVLVGGLGTRLSPLTKTVPKPMVRVEGKPFLEHEIRLLKAHGIRRFVLCAGHLGDQIEDYFADGSRLGVQISYSFDGARLLGPVGALKKAEPLLEGEFFVTYGDAYLRTDYAAMMKTLVDSECLAVMAVYENHNRYGRSDVEVSGGRVVTYDKSSRRPELQWVNFGVSALKKKALALVPEGEGFGEEEFYGELIRRKELLAFSVKERFYEIGTPGSLREFELFISGRG